MTILFLRRRTWRRIPIHWIQRCSRRTSCCQTWARRWCSSSLRYSSWIVRLKLGIVPCRTKRTDFSRSKMNMTRAKMLRLVNHQIMTSRWLCLMCQTTMGSDCKRELKRSSSDTQRARFSHLEPRFSHIWKNSRHLQSKSSRFQIRFSRRSSKAVSPEKSKKCCLRRYSRLRMATPSKGRRYRSHSTNFCRIQGSWKTSSKRLDRRYHNLQWLNQQQTERVHQRWINQQDQRLHQRHQIHQLKAKLPPKPSKLSRRRTTD